MKEKILSKSIKEKILKRTGMDTLLVLKYSKDNWQGDQTISLFAFNQKLFEFKFLLKNNNYYGIDSKEYWSKAYKFDEIRGYELVKNTSIIEKKNAGFGKMITGGLLFGSVGAIAGALSSSSKTEIFQHEDFSIRLLLNDLSFASVDFPCFSSTEAYRLLNTLKLIEELYISK